MVEKCFICQNYYVKDSTTPLKIKKGEEIKDFTKIKYRNKRIPLCNGCFRMMAFMILGEKMEILIEDNNNEE